jgi:hypothetical protein
MEFNSNIPGQNRGQFHQTRIEQRRFSRMKMIIGIICHRSGKPAANVFTDDVSLGGIKFTTQTLMDRDEMVELDIPVGSGKYQRIKGRIAWIRKGVLNNYEGGIEFGLIDSDARRAWQKFIERNTDQEI